MSGPGHQLAARAMAWMDSLWDPEVRLLRYPATSLARSSHAWRTHGVRETSWYALGLLMRADTERAAEALASVLTHQYMAPGTPYDGTWRRSPQEPQPPADPVLWNDYDPNWREFVGCTLLLVLHEYGETLPDDLVRRITGALALAAGNARERAVSPHYSNIALMSAHLMHEVGVRSGDPALAAAGEGLGRQVFDIWRRTRTFAEFNSPTYYGVDLFALALWRGSSSPVLRELGDEMEVGLWTEIGRRYHPGLRNLAGPYDRSYGMDLSGYVSLIGQWIALADGLERAPLPAGDPSQAVHAHDLCFAPCFALLGAHPKAAGLLAPAPEEPRWVSTTVTESPRRIATSWLGPHHMIGAQDTGGAKTDADDQYHPVTVHWRGDDGAPHWLRVMPSAGVDATVTKDGVLEVTAAGDLEFESDCRADVGADRWLLPGLSVTVSTGAAARPAPYRIRYPGPLRLTLEISPL
ncbi:hypothetical protein OHA25_48530 [Nonomuraea sp. NBC_00507]|uniref:hypothetical protein n=1 Tax=Nonomuraea sp. NBC_00507 TaxID=2976002 RepID=UPI002E181176